MKDLRRKQIVSIQYYNSPCGEIILASAGDCLCLCDWNKMPCAERNKHRLMRLLNAECIIAPSAVLEETKKELDEYFAGKRHTFEIPLHPVGTVFQKTSMASLTWNSVWRNKNLQRDCTKDKQDERYKGCGTSHRCQWHQHSHPLPSRHWHQPLTDRIRRRHRGKKITTEYRMSKYALWLNLQLNFYYFWTQRKLNKLINSISLFEKAKLDILLPIAVQLLLERHYCAPRRALLCHK